MGDGSSIEWTDATWNPVRGCSRVSRGCEHCYAEGVARRFSGPGQPYEGLVRLGRDGKARAQWNGTVRMVPEHLADPLRWTRPRRVFVNSMSDLFHESLPFEDIAAIFGVMAACPQHTFQVLTKRPERAREFFAWIVEQDASLIESTTPGLTHSVWCALRAEAQHHPDGDSGPLHTKRCADPDGLWPLPNVWLGTSVEDQAAADERIPHLLACPAAVRFVSYEPALGPVRFREEWLGLRCDFGHDHRRGVGTYRAGECPYAGLFVCGAPLRDQLSWVIVGGESGPGARPFDLAWARSVVAQCREAGVPVFFKQGGARPLEDGAPLRLKHRKGADLAELPEDLRVREFPEVTR